jgi:hypothetical protein
MRGVMRCWAGCRAAAGPVAVVGFWALAALTPLTVRADKALLVPATINGKESAIYEKLIVSTSTAQLRSTPGGEGQFIEPFAIFYKLRGDDGQLETAGHFRVGDSQGNPLGWIAKEDVVVWNTRFVLEPLEPTPDRTFVVDLGDGTRAELKIVPAGKRRFAFITASADAADAAAAENGPFPVVVCTAEVGSSSFTDELNDLKDMKLEVMFVLESTDFMLSDFDGKRLLDFMIELAEELARMVKADPQLSESHGVRFGIIEYQDTSKLADYVARVTVPLTEDMDAYVAGLRGLQPKAIEGDWPEDALAGLSLALNEAGWSSNSIKHVVHIGMGAMQVDPRGSGENQFGGDWNEVTATWNRDNPAADCGYNSTGLTIERLIQQANPEGGSADDRARAQVSFHSLWIGRPVADMLEAAVAQSGGGLNAADILREAAETVRLDSETLNSLVGNGTMPIEYLTLLFQVALVSHQEQLAQTQYRQLTANRGIEGYFRQVKPNAEEVSLAAADITAKLRATIDATGRIRRGEISDADELAAGDNPILERYYAVVGAAAEQFQDQPVLSGSAPIRDDRGRLVAQKKVLITREELTRLRSTFDALHQTFQTMTAKVDRQDVSTILDTLKQAIAEPLAGQPIDADVELRELITDLPLRTNALDVTPGDIAVMSSDAFTQWLNKLEASLFRIQDLLDRETQWMTLNENAENDKFTFLHLSELP